MCTTLRMSIPCTNSYMVCFIYIHMYMDSGQPYHCAGIYAALMAYASSVRAAIPTVRGPDFCAETPRIAAAAQPKNRNRDG